MAPKRGGGETEEIQGLRRSVEALIPSPSPERITTHSDVNRSDWLKGRSDPEWLVVGGGVLRRSTGNTLGNFYQLSRPQFPHL